MKQLNTPILLIIFNRPELTEQVFKKIKEAKPKQLFIAADGARINNTDDVIKCRKAREFVLNNIDWDCEVATLLRDKNLGCRQSVSSAINWFFNNVEQGIILEDDTLPDVSFFNYAEQMLNQYQNNEKVMHIAGANFQKHSSNKNNSFYFSKYPQIWGWAAWKRAWKNYDVLIADWPAFKYSEQFKNWCFHKTEQEYWTNIFNDVYTGKTDTWDYQWIYAMIKNNALGIVPAKNLVTNIGFNAEATHTKIYDADFADLPAHEHNFPDDKNLKLKSDKQADEWVFSNVYNKNRNQDIQTPLRKIRNSIKSFSKLPGV